MNCDVYGMALYVKSLAVSALNITGLTVHESIRRGEKLLQKIRVILLDYWFTQIISLLSVLVEFGTRHSKLPLVDYIPAELN